MNSKIRRVNELRDLIGDRLAAQRKERLAVVEKSFSEELKQLKRLRGEIDRLEKPLAKKLQKQRYGLTYSGSIEAKTYGFDFPDGVEDDLTRIKELLVLGRAEEAQKKIDRLVGQFSLGK